MDAYPPLLIADKAWQTHWLSSLGPCQAGSHLRTFALSALPSEARFPQLFEWLVASSPWEVSSASTFFHSLRLLFSLWLCSLLPLGTELSMLFCSSSSTSSLTPSSMHQAQLWLQLSILLLFSLRLGLVQPKLAYVDRMISILLSCLHIKCTHHYIQLLIFVYCFLQWSVF